MTLPNNGPYSGIKSALALLSKTAGVELKKDHISVSVVYPFMTETDFEKNTMKTHVMPMNFDGGGKLPPMDPPEHVARKILEAIETGAPEIFAHEWMKKNL
jgi:short-subunit dehydrogenase